MPVAIFYIDGVKAYLQFIGLCFWVTVVGFVGRPFSPHHISTITEMLL